jgi:hypothetical protein
MMDVSQILPNLFVGSYPAGQEDVDQLRRELGVTAVLNVQTDEDMAYPPPLCCNIWWATWLGLYPAGSRKNSLP